MYLVLQVGQLDREDLKISTSTTTTVYYICEISIKQEVVKSSYQITKEVSISTDVELRLTMMESEAE